MAAAYISFFDNVDYGGYGNGAQCFEGFCNQDRVDVNASTSAWTAPVTVEAGTKYAVVHLTAPALVYAGPTAADVVKQARATTFPAGWWPMSVAPGYVVSIKDLPA